MASGLGHWIENEGNSKFKNLQIMNTANSNELMLKSIRPPTTISSKTVGGANIVFPWQVNLTLDAL